MLRGCCTIRGCARIERRGERDAERPAVHPRRQIVTPLVTQFLFFLRPRVRRQFGIINVFRSEGRDDIARRREPPPGGPTGSASELQTLSSKNYDL